MVVSGFPTPKANLLPTRAVPKSLAPPIISVHQSGAVIPLPGSAGLDGSHPEDDAEIVADRVGDLDIIIDAIKAQAAIDFALGFQVAP